MSLIEIDLPCPSKLLGGWAALGAVCAARGWKNEVYATADQWLYHDGAGNWACLRCKSKDQITLVGHDHEYSETYFGAAAEYFGEEETNLLAGAPKWWEHNLDPRPFGEWIGFIYGWDGQKWLRVDYEKPDGFETLGLLDVCSIDNTEMLKEYASNAPGLNGKSPHTKALEELVGANGNLTKSLLEAVVPGWDIDAGVAAARKFLEVEIS